MEGGRVEGRRGRKRGTALRGLSDLDLNAEFDEGAALQQHRVDFYRITFVESSYEGAERSCPSLCVLYPLDLHQLLHRFKLRVAGQQNAIQ
jgi:hypothetical protein